jgi:hypothetical protein
VASVGSTTTTTATSASGGANGASNHYAAAVAYAQCMRAHGVPNFPDPTSNGAFELGSAASSGLIDPNSAAYQRANSDCQHLLSNGGLLKLAQCMRSRGVPNFPDPQPQANGGIALPLGPNSGVDPNSAQFQAAWKACSRPTTGGSQ